MRQAEQSSPAVAERVRPAIATGGSRAWARTRLWNRVLASPIAGPAIVLACLSLPLLLGEIARALDEASKRGYISSLAPASGSHAGGSMVAQPDARSRLLEQHYYFVNGCVSAPGECVGALPSHWGEYYTELGRLYEEAAVIAASAGQRVKSFEEWAVEHTHFIISPIAPLGARVFAQALSDNPTAANIHLVGTSAGGAALFTYLSQAMRGDVSLDRRIRSMMTVDSPLGYQPPFGLDDVVSGLQASAMKTDVQTGLGEWAEVAGIALFTINTREDVVGYDPIPRIRNDSSPHYPQSDVPRRPSYLDCDALPCRLLHTGEFLDLGSTWHIYTGSHMAESARQFIIEHWR